MVNKCRYAVLNGRRERDIVRPPAPVQITPELLTATMLYSQGARNLVGSRGSCARAVEMQTSNEVRLEDWPAFSMYTVKNE